MPLRYTDELSGSLDVNSYTQVFEAEEFLETVKGQCEVSPHVWGVTDRETNVACFTNDLRAAELKDWVVFKIFVL